MRDLTRAWMSGRLEDQLASRWRSLQLPVDQFFQAMLMAMVD